MENRICKTCPKILPAGYKYNKCESCRTKQAQNIKKGMKAAAGAMGTIASVTAFIITKGKYKPKK